MPPRWIHETIDLISWGRIYYSVHRQKDRASQTLGIAHRQKNHELYVCARQRFSKGASLEDGLRWMTEEAKKTAEADWKDGLKPDQIEARQARNAHDMIDYAWDSLSQEERLGWAAAFRDVVLNPKKYHNLFEPQDFQSIGTSGPYHTLRSYVADRSLEQLLYLTEPDE